MIGEGPNFRPTNEEFIKAMKKMTSTKSANPQIDKADDDEEDDDDEDKKEEKKKTVEAKILRINMEQISGNGWICEGTKDEKIYSASVASEVYNIPDGVEKKGYLYPNSTINVTLSVDNYRRKYQITEFKGDFSGIDNWKKADTTVVANQDVALALTSSAGRIEYNDGDTQNNITVEKGKIEINADNINLKGNVKLDEKPLYDTMHSIVDDENKIITYDKCFSTYHLTLQKSKNVVVLSMSDIDIELTKEEKLLCHIYDERFWSLLTHSFMALTSSTNNTDVLKVTSDGNIFVYTTEENPKTVTFNTTHTWLASNDDKNTIIATGGKACTCDCVTNDTTNSFINYCPMCHKFGYLKDTPLKMSYYPNGYIECTDCETKYCIGCGRKVTNGNCSDNKKLLFTEDNVITVTGSSTCKCQNCSDTVTKTYLNYCPDCFGFTTLKEFKKNGKVMLKCEKCGKTWCVVCGAENTKENSCYHMRLFFVRKS